MVVVVVNYGPCRGFIWVGLYIANTNMEGGGLLTQLLMLHPNPPKTQSGWVGWGGLGGVNPTFDAEFKPA